MPWDLKGDVLIYERHVPRVPYSDIPVFQLLVFVLEKPRFSQSFAPLP